MRNKELLRLLLADKIIEKCKRESFNNECYWNEFNTTYISFDDFGIFVETPTVLRKPQNFKLSLLKFIYQEFLELQEKDKKYGALEIQTKTKIETENDTDKKEN
jgi:hypothetical protein